jgi:NADPH2:quinone reductase
MYGTAAASDSGVVRALGATPIDYRDDYFVTRLCELGGVDVVLDGIGGLVSVRSYRVLRRGGRLVLFGHRSTLVDGRRSASKLVAFYAGGATTLLANVLPDHRRVMLYQIAKLRGLRPEWFRADLTTLMTLLAEGRLAPLIAERIPLEEAPRAHEILAHDGIAGKLVIVPVHEER